jgi:hypothetical protein
MLKLSQIWPAEASPSWLPYLSYGLLQNVFQAHTVFPFSQYSNQSFIYEVMIVLDIEYDLETKVWIVSVLLAIGAFSVNEVGNEVCVYVYVPVCVCMYIYKYLLLISHSFSLSFWVHSGISNSQMTPQVTF